MSKYKWKTLPALTKSEECDFILHADRKMVAWELLRRIPEYRADWEQYNTIVINAKEKAGTQAAYSKWTKMFIPQMEPQDHGDYRKWFARVFNSGENPLATHAHLYYPQKWGLERMVACDHPYNENVVFSSVKGIYPLRIRQEDELENFFYEVDYAEETAIVNAVLPDKALFVFDLTAPLGVQLKALKIGIEQAKKENKKIYGVKRTSVPKAITEHVSRHLRILDLLLVDPNIGPTAIAKALGYDETLSGIRAAQQGDRWKRQALYARDNYRLFLNEDSRIKNN